MYIMTNKNPEDLYLQSLQIDEEETFLGKDIKRQQKEIDNLIKKKKKEIKKENDDSQKNEGENKDNQNIKKIKTTKTFLDGFNLPLKKKESKEKIELEKKIKLRKNKSILPTKRASLNLNNDDLIVSNSKKNVIIYNNILYNIKAINKELIDVSIENTEKKLRERKDEITKNFTKNYGKKKKSKEVEEDKKNQDIFQLEDLSFEKKLKARALKKKDEDYANLRKSQIEKILRDQKKSTIIKKDFSKITGLTDLTNLRNENRRMSQKEKDLNLKKLIKLPEELPVINDLSLSLSDIEEGANKKLFKLKKRATNSKFLLRQKTVNILNKTQDEEKTDNILNDTDKSLISKDKKDNLSILLERKVLYNTPNNFNVKSEFAKPHSLLNFLNKQKKQNLNEERAKLIEKKYEKLKNPNKSEKSKDSDEEESEFSISRIGNEDSFFKFVENIQKKENMETLLKNENELEVKDENNKKQNFINSISSDDKSLISFYDEVSLEDIELLQDNNINHKKVYRIDFLQNENIRKNLELNKLTHLIRSSFFDRESINTDINLTTKQQSNHFKTMNRRLNKLLFVDMKRIRGRFNREDDLNVSYHIEKKDYDKILKNLADEGGDLKKKYMKSIIKKENKLNEENLQENPLKEIMIGYHNKIIKDNIIEMDKIEKNKSIEKENEKKRDIKNRKIEGKKVKKEKDKEEKKEKVKEEKKEKVKEEKKEKVKEEKKDINENDKKEKEDNKEKEDKKGKGNKKGKEDKKNKEGKKSKVKKNKDKEDKKDKGKKDKDKDKKVKVEKKKKKKEEQKEEKKQDKKEDEKEVEKEDIKETKKEKENIKESDNKNKNKIIKKVNINEKTEKGEFLFEFLNSDANLLGPKKSSERVNLNSDKNIIKDKIEKKISNVNDLKIRKSDSNITHLNYFKKIKENVKSRQKKNLENIDNKKTYNVQSKKGAVFIFKAKSIEKNIVKYPQENSKRYQIREENKVYTDPLTVTQELISDNLRGKKYYLNYLYNISDKDLKVKDNFKIDHWEREILGNNEKTFKKKPLPENNEAFFVFNDKKLNLQKYSYMYHKDIEYDVKDLSILTHNLKYLPLNILEIMPEKLRNFGKKGKKEVEKETNQGILGIKPISMGADSFKNVNKTRSGKATTIKPRNETNIISGSSYTNHRKYQEEITFKKNIYERIYKKLDDFNYKTISHYFLIEDNLYYQLVDSKRKIELIKKISERNRAKENRIEIKDEIQNILEFDLKTNSRRYIKWSGSDVLCHYDEDEHKKKWNDMINALEDFNMIIWHENPTLQRYQKLRYAFYILATNDYFDYTILGIVILNSVFMALDGNLLTPEVIQRIDLSNYAFNSIFILEYVVKFIGLGPFVYFSDAFTYLDTLIIAFAILDMCTPNENTESASTGKVRSVSSQLSFLRVFRIFRVIRLTKVLRRLKSMRLIIVSIKKALSNVSYLICILIMFILIFQLLGMSLLSGNYHYQSFFIGFYTTYQILTMENWNSLLYELWPMNYLCFFYFVAWIFIGNYVIFNLFISILLQTFDEKEEEDEDDLTLDQKIEKMYVLPAYLNMIKKSAFSKKQTKLKPYRKKFDKEEGADEHSESFENSEDIQSTKISSSKLESYYKTSSFNDNMSYDNSKSMVYKKNEDNSDENESQKYCSTVEKNMQHWKKVNILFEKNDCENALYFLSQTNKFRIFCMKLMLNKWFDRFILFLILCSTVRLVLDTFVNGYEFVLAFDILDAVFNIIFLLECLIKVCAMGFVVDEGSYLTDNWNRIDIIIVICSAFDFQNLFTKYFTSGRGTSSVQFLKVIRLLRTLRPLRFISHNVSLKLIITSLFDSILPIVNALFIVIVVYYIFSIVGISLFYSNMHNCYILNSEGYFDLAIESFNNILLDYEVPDNMVSISNFCSNRYNGIMDTGPAFKFSNIITSFITSYVLSTMEGWPDIMNSYTIYENFYGIYFIVSNLVVAYFFLNLFTGIMFRYFNESFKREQKIAEDDKKAPKYYDFLAQICNAETHYIVWKKPPKDSYKYILREFADNSYLDNFIMIVIFLNLIFMALNFEGSSAGYNLALTIVNYIFTGIFIIECIIKLLGYGFRAYFHSGWNKFDFFVVCSSLVDLAMTNVEGFDASFLKSFQIIRVLRVLRITRVLRLIKSLKGLEKLIQTLSWSLTALSNVLLLMLIFFCIFAILGCYFYDNIYYKDYKDIFVYINEYYNLDNFYNSFLLVFRCATGENWNNIMMELAFVDPDKVSEAYAYIYFIISNFANSIIMLNLFLMVTLQQYDEFTNKNYNPIEKFESFLIDFNNAWNKFSDDEDEGFRIKKIYVIQFFMEFNWKKLNFQEQGKLEAVKKYITELELRTDDDGYVYYHDVIYKVINKQMGSLIDRNNMDNNTIFKREDEVQKEIKHMINKYIRKNSKKKSPKSKHITIPFNPLTSHLYFKLSYNYLKTFMNFYKENCEALRNMEEQSNDDKK